MVPKGKDVSLYKTSGQDTHTRQIVLLLFPVSVRWHLLGTQITTELNPHANKSLCPSSLTCSHRSYDSLSPAFPQSAWIVPGQGLIYAQHFWAAYCLPEILSQKLNYSWKRVQKRFWPPQRTSHGGNGGLRGGGRTG